MRRTSRRRFLSTVIALPAGFAVALFAGRARAEHYAAKLCNNCGFGSKKDDCVKCGKWMGTTKIPARLCGEHGFGSKKDDCAKCGKWVGTHDQLAYVCNNCGFGSKKDNCVKCGKWAP